ncbi:MAG: lysylphosphatidylglycerol synthase transmembrane domain-containing protein [Candidatus Saccharimonadales bacterium]
MIYDKFHFNRRYLFIVLILVLGVYVLVPQFGNFNQSWQKLSHPNSGWVISGIVFTALTYLAAAATYSFLAFKKLNYWRTVIFQYAAMFINRLLPGGIGALGANYVYLKKSGHSSTQAGTLVGVNNFLGFLGHFVLSIIVLLIYSGRTGMTHKHINWSAPLKYLAVFLVLAAILAVIFGRKRFYETIADVRNQLLSYRHRPGNLLAALLSSMTLTVCNVLCLYACMMALGVHLSLFSVFLIFSFGVGAGTATPTPGGIGGYEAALAAGFVAYRIDSSTALAIAFLYRLISYWGALVVGAMAFGISQKRGYI